MKIAIVYDRVNKWGGAERVLLALHKIYPKANLYTSVYDPKGAPWAKVFPKIYTSFLQKLPFAKNNHEYLAPLMPIAFSMFDFSDYDLVISVTSEFAKCLTIKTPTKHICYCLTPTRYLWSGYDNYFHNPIFKILGKPAVAVLRKIDRYSSIKPNTIVAISSEVQKRIKKYYGRSSEIIFPPVAMQKKKARKGKYYLLVSRLDYGYKKVILAINAFNRLGVNLVVVGTGREEGKLRKIANRNIKFTGRVNEKKLEDLYLNAKALVMPQEEDFGIVAVEAQSYGVPVIAYKKGGASDTVINGKTGLHFNRQTEKSLIGAILRFEKMSLRGDNLVTNAKKFSFENFKRKFVKIVEHELKRV